MPVKNDSKDTRRGLGIFLAALRDSRKESQDEFAAKLNLTTSAVGNYETGRRIPRADVVAKLEKLFSGREEEIRREVARHRSVRSATIDSPWLETQHTLEAQIAAGEWREALDAIKPLLSTTSDIRDVRQHIWLYMRQAEIATLRNRPADLVSPLLRALDASNCLKLPQSQIVTLIDQLACAELWYAESRSTRSTYSRIDESLRRFPDASQLWYRKGAIAWGRGNMSDAHAALSAALKHKRAPRRDILCTRGLVLVEWERFREALTDLDEALNNPRRPPLESAVARSAQLWAAYSVGDISPEEVFADFARLENLTPENAWLFYYRGLCNLRSGNTYAGAQEWENQALAYDKPGLPAWKVSDIKKWMSTPPLSDAFHPQLI